MIFFETDFMAHTKPVSLCLNFMICTLLDIPFRIFQSQFSPVTWTGKALMLFTLSSSS